jgi:hypothetical protein
MTNQTHTFTLPSDLGAQVGRDTLARLVHQIARACAARLAPDLPRDGSSGTASGCGLLGLLTYCYARSVLSSRAITEIAEADPAVRSLCGDAIPERDEIAGFRRAHRALIQECMKQVYEAAWQAMVNQATPGTVPCGIAETLPRPSQTARFDQDNVLHQIGERISQAAQMDCWSRDW